jgi:hypothetical protein
MTDKLETTRTPTQVEILRRIKSQILDELFVALPGKVESYDNVLQTVDVKPLLSKTIVDQYGQEESTELPVLPKVPVVFPRGGDFFISLPIEEGDNVLLVFCDRSIDNYWFSDGQSSMDQNDFRTHDLPDAVAIPGFFPSTKSITDIISGDAVFGKQRGVQIRAKGDSVDVTSRGLPSSTGGFVSLAQKIDLIISKLDTVFRTAWTPVAQDGGAALKTAYLTAFTTPPSSTASTNLKAD